MSGVTWHHLGPRRPGLWAASGFGVEDFLQSHGLICHGSSLIPVQEWSRRPWFPERDTEDVCTAFCDVSQVQNNKMSLSKWLRRTSYTPAHAWRFHTLWTEGTRGRGGEIHKDSSLRCKFRDWRRKERGRDNTSRELSLCSSPRSGIQFTVTRPSTHIAQGWDCH